jgi:hypothetical protein
MTDSSLVTEAEEHVRQHAEALTQPGTAECLGCYVARMLDTFGCDETLRWARRFRDLRSPRADGLERRLGAMGGFCDCEIFLNGIQLARHVLVRDIDTDDLEAPEALPDCAGVHSTSTRPCGNWERVRRR